MNSGQFKALKIKSGPVIKLEHYSGRFSGLISSLVTKAAPSDELMLKLTDVRCFGGLILPYTRSFSKRCCNNIMKSLYNS